MGGLAARPPVDARARDEVTQTSWTDVVALPWAWILDRSPRATPGTHADGQLRLSGDPWTRGGEATKQVGERSYPGWLLW
jgi:hypothetical protein